MRSGRTTPTPACPRRDGVGMGCDGGCAGFGPAVFDPAGSEAAVRRATAVLAGPLCRSDQRAIESVLEPFERFVSLPARAALAASAWRCDQRTIDEAPGSPAGRGPFSAGTSDQFQTGPPWPRPRLRYVADSADRR